MIQNVTGKLAVLLLGAVSVSGCREKDRYREVAEVATQAADRQAQQNSEMARVNREVAEGTRRLVEADAQARKEIVVVHQQLQAERATLSDGHDALETERKQIAQQRRTESLFVPAIKFIAVAAVALGVVLFCLALLFGARSSEATDADVNELLIRELVSDTPQLLRVSQRSSTPLLTASGEAADSHPQGEP